MSTPMKTSMVSPPWAGPGPMGVRHGRAPVCYCQSGTTTGGVAHALLRRPRTWLTVERLPAYAPELNPLEPVWGNVKTRELANVCAPDLARLCRPLRCGFARICQQQTLARAFLRHAGLSF